MLLSGAQIVVETLLAHGVNTVFGYPGGSVLALYDAIYDAGERLTHVLTASEMGAAHAADGYARASGLGVCISTSGPGATNLVTGIATAYMDSSPVVFITGNVPRRLIGTDSFQEIDITGITLPITKYSVMVTDVRDLEKELRLAFRLAREGRPGPVLIDIPRDVQESLCEYTPSAPEQVSVPIPSAAQIEDAAKLINESKNPIILVGGGAKGAHREALRLIELLGCRSVSTVMGLGTVPASHESFLGIIGVHGSLAANRAVKKSDLVIAVGVRFSDRTARPGEDKLKILHIDADRSEINKNVLSRGYVVGDAAAVLAELCKRVAPRKTENQAVLHRPLPKNRPERAVRLLNDVFGDVTVVTDVGQHQVWTVQQWRFERPSALVTPGGLGTMGFGMGAAVGTALATRKRVVLITGDGSFLMDNPELTTAARLKLPITVVLMHNGSLGMVRQQQKGGSGHISQTTLENVTDFAALARAYGAKAFRARGAVTLRRAAEYAAQADGPVFIDYIIGIDDTVREVKI